MLRIELRRNTKKNYIKIINFKLVILVCLATTSYGQSVVGITDGDVVMNWTISDNNTVYPRSVVSPKDQRVFFFHSGSINALTSVNYTQRTIYLGDLSRSIVSFNLSRLKVEDAGRYTFRILDMIVGGQVLVMAVSPSQPVVTEVVAAVFGSDYKLNCFALSNSEPSDHGMIMKSEWKINGVSVSTSGRYTVQNTELIITGLTLNDNGTQVTCVAYENQRAKSLESVPFGISVKFGPDNIQLSQSGAILVVENNSTRIICTADCNPSCFFHWGRSASMTTVSTSQTLFFDKVTRSDADTYTCYVSNNVTRRNSSISTTITVIYGPTPGEMTLTPSNKFIVVEEYTTVNIMCSANCAPACQYVWTDPHSFRIENRNLFLSMDREKLGVYTCTAKNEQNQENYRTATTTVSVTVYFGPGDSINVGSIPSTYCVNLGQAIPDIVCSATCNPLCSFSWYKNGILLINEATLSIGVVQKMDRGNYTCLAMNRFLGLNRSSSKYFIIIVFYGAEITDMSVQKGTTVNENESATFQCSVDSYPKSMMTLKRERDGTILKTEVDVLQSQYWLPSAHCLDTDNYTCSASNNISQPAVRTIQFFVKCHPRSDFHAPFVNVTYSKRYGEAVLKYRVISYPPPRFTWTFLGNGSESRELPKSVIQSDYGQQSELQFTKLDIEELGSYRVVANNAINPPATAVLWLAVADVPETPSNVTITDITHNSFQVQWVSGYSGGPKQTFYIVASSNDKNISVYASDPGYQNVGSTVIENLSPNTEYSIYMSANNSIGTSNMTIAVTAFTDKETSADKETGPPVAALAGGIGAGCAVILFALIVVYLWRRYQGTKKGLHDDDLSRELEERKHQVSGLKDNPVYDSSESGPVVAAVVKPKRIFGQTEDPSKLYAQVDKSNAKKGKMAPKGKPIKTYNAASKGNQVKTSRGDVYENTPLPLKCSAENVYENPGHVPADPNSSESVYENPETSASKGHLRNKDGLRYADLKLGPSTTKYGKSVIHGLENRTEYADIAFGKRGEPLPESDEEKENDGSRKNNDTKMKTDE